jgi:hypothetical protein
MPIKVTLNAQAVRDMIERQPDALVEVERKVLEQATEAIARRVLGRAGEYIDAAIGREVGVEYCGKLVPSGKITALVYPAVEEAVRQGLGSAINRVAVEMVETKFAEAIIKAEAAGERKGKEAGRQTIRDFPEDLRHGGDVHARLIAWSRGEYPA